MWGRIAECPIRDARGSDTQRSAPQKHYQVKNLTLKIFPLTKGQSKFPWIPVPARRLALPMPRSVVLQAVKETTRTLKKVNQPAVRLQLNRLSRLNLLRLQGKAMTPKKVNRCPSLQSDLSLKLPNSRFSGSWGLSFGPQGPSTC